MPSQIGLPDLKTLYSELSDPARYLHDAPRLTPETSARLGPLLPEWLKKPPSSIEQRFSDAAWHWPASSNALKDVPHSGDIKAFTADELLTQMGKTNDSSPAKVATQSLPTRRCGTDVHRLGGIPRDRWHPREKNDEPDATGHRQPRRTPQWQPATQSSPGSGLACLVDAGLHYPEGGGLIEQVDIGTVYPRYLQQALLSDSPQAQAFQRTFAEQLPAQLPLEALQQMLDNKNGMTRQGLHLIEEALLQPDAEDRQFHGGRPVVIRHLAFLRKPQARPDLASNMFIVEAQDARTGPHLLYRPLYAPIAVGVYATRQALLQSVVSAADLQNSVLTWMSGDARPVYANGGFLEPHIVRFLRGRQVQRSRKARSRQRSPSTPATMNCCNTCATAN